MEMVATWGGLSQNSEGFVKFSLLLAYGEIGSAVQSALLIDKVLSVKITKTEETSTEVIVLNNVEFYSMTMKNDGDSKLVFRTFSPNIPKLNFAQLNSLLDAEIDVEVSEME